MASDWPVLAFRSRWEIRMGVWGFGVWDLGLGLHRDTILIFSSFEVSYLRSLNWACFGKDWEGRGRR